MLVVRLALLVLVSAVGLAAAQPALANSGPDPRLSSLIASCKARSSGDAWKECVKGSLKAKEKSTGGVETGRAAQSLCKGELGVRLGTACVTKLTGLFATCKARSSGDAWKECVKSQLTGAGTERDFDPAKVAQSLCQGELGAKLGEGCVAKLSTLIASCNGSSSGDGWKACVKSQLPTAPAQSSPAGFEPARAAQSLCQGPLGVKLGEGCVTKLTALLTACKSQASGVGDTFKACVTAQLPAETRAK